MRDVARKILDESIDAVVVVCKKFARTAMASGSGEATILALAWSIAQNAAVELRKELEGTPEGLALVAQVERTAAGKRPS